MKKPTRIVLIVVVLLVVGGLGFGACRFAWRTIRALHGIHD
ncbi:MAG TPA: hypothetical protein VMV21_09780 [Vicinamibacteria bacterium]|jgi:hypothetical protein|nr:hypothetical protein [Vicinamibacteria bacterium]